MPYGLANSATVPIPSIDPNMPPARTIAELGWRMFICIIWLPLVQRAKVFSREIQTPTGEVEVVKVLTIPLGIPTFRISVPSTTRAKV
jgi:hypothetical protein